MRFISWCLQVTLSGFRSGKFMTLVATNVAARGLDINDVQLIIQVCMKFKMFYLTSVIYVHLVFLLWYSYLSVNLHVM